MSDLVKRLREVWEWHRENERKDHTLLRQAADLIEQQQARISELEQRESELENKVLALATKKAELLRSNDELAATVGYLRGILDDIDYELSNYTEHADCLINIRSCIKDFRAVRDLPPDTNLNAIKREVAREAYIAGLEQSETGVMTSEYVNQCYPDKE